MNSLMVPIVLWGRKPPTHKIRCITFTKDGKNILTGCADGQVCVWDVDQDENTISPRALLFGHTSSVVSIAEVLDGAEETKYFLSASTNNELLLWDLSDCRCIEHANISGSPTKLIPLELNVNGKSTPCVACIGLFAEVFIISSMSLNVITTLISRIYPDWISSCCIMNHGTETSVVGLTLSGTIKVWQIPGTLNSSQSILEDESKQLRCLNAKELCYNPAYTDILLVVCPYEWQIYDARDFSLIRGHQAPGCSVLTGGDILYSCNKIILWDQGGSIYIYSFDFSTGRAIANSVKSSRDHELDLVCSFSSSRSDQLALPPVFVLNSTSCHDFLLYSGNSKGVIDIWSIKKCHIESHESFVDLLSLKCSYSLSDHWDSLVRPPSGIIDNLGKNSSASVTTSLYLENIGQLACGRDDGSIIIVPAARACKSQLIRDGPMTKKCWVPHRTLRGHLDRITRLLYPHQESDRYSPQIFVSGSADFSVVMWDLFTGTQLHVFNVHGGEISELIVPPEECSSRIQQSICSVATDHSVAILSLRERKCVMLAASHTSMVTTIKWRPMDDFILVSCADGGLFVWQMETGHLDRYLTGVTASQVLESCDESQCNKDIAASQSSVNISQVIRRRNLAGFKAAAQQGLRNIIETIEEKMQDDETDSPNIATVSCPKAMVVQPIRASVSHDDDSHVIFFNTEAIIGTLLQEQAMRNKRSRSKLLSANGGTPSSAKKVFNAIIYQVKNQFLDSSDPGSSGTSSPNIDRKVKDKKTAKMEIDSIIDIAQLLLSCLHGWGLDQNLDNICKTKLGIFEPVIPVSFGLLSRDGQVSLLFPTWAKSRQLMISTSSSPVHARRHTTFQTSYQQSINGHVEKCSHKNHWEISSTVTTNHLLSIIAVSNTLMELSNVRFTHDRANGHTNGTNEDSTSGNASESYMSDPSDNSQIKQGWALLSTMHCVLLQELLGSENYKAPRLELLARRWQDRCLEVREAAQALLLAKLRQIEPEGRRKIVQEWAKFMPDYIHQQHIDLVPNTRTEESDSTSTHPSTEDRNERSSISSVELVSEVSTSTRSNAPKMSYEARRRQATAVIILGVIGAEFGQEMEPSRSNTSSPFKSASHHDDIPDGFKLSNYSLARNTCKALVYLLLHPASSRLPAHAPIRRGAIDLLGRGFTVWEPYIEVSAVLLGLLELCVDYDLHKASIYSGLPLSAKADSCRSAHHALSLIATAKPPTFITTIAREVARHNAASTNPQHQALLATSIILRSRAEILRIIEILAEKNTSDVADLLVEVMDIVLFCIDTNALRTSNSLIESVPALSRFHSISYDPRSRRIAVGIRQGSIFLYDLRSNKHQLIFKGRHPITTLAFSPDGKYLSAYSVSDNHLSFWTTSSSLFGMLQSQVKCVKTLRLLPGAVSQRLAAAPDLNRDSMKNFMKLAWVSNRTTVLLLPDGNEYRSHV